MYRIWNKVIDVGVAKTGSASLGRAYQILGLKRKSWDPHLFEQFCAGQFDEIIETAKHYDAFEDSPWRCVKMWKLMDVEFPGSKFILLERDLDSWVKSYINHFSEQQNRNDIDPIYLKSGLEDDLDKVAQHYIRSTGKAREYFKDRPDDLLVMNVCEGDGWEKLCPFLELPIPDEPFPHDNKTPDRTPVRARSRAWLFSKARGLKRRLTRHRS